VVETLRRFLHPLTGGPDGDGWAFGRNIYVSELYELLEGIAGVDYVPDIVLYSQCPPNAPRCVAATELWHANGDLIGLGLAAHHLPQAQIDPARVVISAAFLAVQVTLAVVPRVAATPEEVNRIIKTAVKRFFHALHGGPDGTAARQITAESIRTLVRGLPPVQSVSDIDLQSDPSRLIQNGPGQVIGVRVEAQELVDVQVTVLYT
jgi:hypothetical protein